MTYFYLDFDNTGRVKKALLLSGRVEELAAFSQRLRETIDWLTDRLVANGAIVVMQGGDEVLVSSWTLHRRIVELLAQEAFERALLPITLGNGATPGAAWLDLVERKARKALPASLER